MDRSLAPTSPSVRRRCVSAAAIAMPESPLLRRRVSGFCDSSGKASSEARRRWLGSACRTACCRRRCHASARSREAGHSSRPAGRACNAAGHAAATCTAAAVRPGDEPGRRAPSRVRGRKARSPAPAPPAAHVRRADAARGARGLDRESGALGREMVRCMALFIARDARRWRRRYAGPMLAPAKAFRQPGDERVVGRSRGQDSTVGVHRRRSAASSTAPELARGARRQLRARPCPLAPSPTAARARASAAPLEALAPALALDARCRRRDGAARRHGALVPDAADALATRTAIASARRAGPRLEKRRRASPRRRAASFSLCGSRRRAARAQRGAAARQGVRRPAAGCPARARPGRRAAGAVDEVTAAAREARPYEWPEAEAGSMLGGAAREGGGRAAAPAPPPSGGRGRRIPGAGRVDGVAAAGARRRRRSGV